MKICIRRGAKQIGGTCIEIESQGKRLVLDIGQPLDSPDAESVEMPRVEGLKTPDDSLSGVLLSHPHLDHYGLAFRVPPSTRFLMGAATERILEAIANNLEKLITNTYRVAPVRKAGHLYPLVRRDRHNLTPSTSPLEKHWEEAIFRKWKNGGVGLNDGVPFEQIVSYQVMLRESNEDVGWGELDLLGSTAENVPVAIEVKIYPKEYLLRAIIEVLAYGVAIRKAWSVDGRPLRSQWASVVGKPGRLVHLPLAVVAPASYWKIVLSDSSNRIGFQTPQPVRKSIMNLLTEMRRVKYPLTFVEVTKKLQPANSGLPVIINAVVKDMWIPTGSRSPS